MIDLGSAIHRVLSEYQTLTDFTQVPVEVEMVRKAVCGYSHVDNIEIKAFKLRTTHILGQVQFWRRGGMYKDETIEADIYVSSYLNDCWRRYVSCKEIMHCVLDQEDRDYVGDVTNLKALAETLVNRSIAALEDVQGFKTEVAAEIMATEVLFPLELRETYVDNYRAGLTTDMQLAMRYKIPKQIIKSAMAPHYMANVQKLRGEKRIDFD